jgi:hypothetical protein
MANPAILHMDREQRETWMADVKVKKYYTTREWTATLMYNQRCRSKLGRCRMSGRDQNSGQQQHVDGDGVQKEKRKSEAGSKRWGGCGSYIAPASSSNAHSLRGTVCTNRFLVCTNHLLGRSNHLLAPISYTRHLLH